MAHRQLLAEEMPPSRLRRYFLNQWVRADAEPAIPMDRWDACGGLPEIPEGADIWLGIDVALKRDSSAVAVVYRDDWGALHLVVWIYRADEETKILDFDAVEDLIRDLARRHNVVDAWYDPFGFGRSALTLRSEGIPLTEAVQRNELMCPASQLFYDKMVAGEFRHGGDAALREQVEAARIKDTDRGFRFDKLRSRLQIDALIAAVLATAAAHAEAPTDDDPGVWVLSTVIDGTG